MKPLTGLTVLDFSHVIAGPLSTFYLAQLGARVIKIEQPGPGDVLRGTAKGATQFAALNAGKDFAQIDLKSAAGRAEALALATTCDVLVDNFRPGGLERAGLGYEALRQVNPKLIYCAISGYGTHHAPWAQRGAYDHVIQAATGLSMLAGGPSDPPIKTGFPVVDVMTGVLAAFAVTAAVQERSRTGEGRHIDVSMWGAALQLMYPFTVDTLATGLAPERVGNKGYSGSPASEYFETQEGFIALGANTAGQIVKLYPLLGWSAADAERDLERSAGFARARDPVAFKAKLVLALKTKTAAHWEAVCNAQGIPAARVRNLAEFTGEAVASGALVPTQLQLGEIKVSTPGLGWTSA